MTLHNRQLSMPIIKLVDIMQWPAVAVKPRDLELFPNCLINPAFLHPPYIWSSCFITVGNDCQRSRPWSITNPGTKDPSLQRGVHFRGALLFLPDLKVYGVGIRASCMCIHTYTCKYDQNMANFSLLMSTSHNAFLSTMHMNSTHLSRTIQHAYSLQHRELC